MTLPTDYVDGDVLTAADVNAITLAVNSNTNSKIGAGTFNAKGDLLVGLTNDSVGVLSVGTNGYLLSASSGATEGVAWVPSGGKILQFASDSITNESTTSTSATDIPGLSISFTPVSASSTLLIELTGHASVFNTASANNLNRVAYFSINHDNNNNVNTGLIGRYLTAASTANAASQDSFCVRMVVASGSTSARTIKGQFYVTTDCTVQTQSSTPVILTVLEVAS